MGRLTLLPRLATATVIAVAATLLAVRMWVLEPFTVASESMEPVVPQGSTVWLFKHPPASDPGSLVVFPSPLDGALTLKRVVAGAGQSVAIRDAVLFIDGAPTLEPFVDYESIDGTYFGPVRVPEGHVFVLGDNRSASIDSRDFGAVPMDHLTTPLIWPDFSHPAA